MSLMEWKEWKMKNICICWMCVCWNITTSIGWLWWLFAFSLLFFVLLHLWGWYFGLIVNSTCSHSRDVKHRNSATPVCVLLGCKVSGWDTAGLHHPHPRQYEMIKYFMKKKDQIEVKFRLEWQLTHFSCESACPWIPTRSTNSHPVCFGVR